MITIDVLTKKLTVHAQSYDVKFSTAGFSCIQDTKMSPYGLHKAVELVGHNADPLQSFSSRNPTKIYQEGDLAPIITTRIIRIRGCENGVNSGYDVHGRCVDTFDRFVYIHGVPESLFNEPNYTSAGCFILKPLDMIDVFNAIRGHHLNNETIYISIINYTHALAESKRVDESLYDST